MNGLEQAFYIMAIVFMSLVFLMIIALVIAVFVIKAKINNIHDAIENKVNTVTDLAEKGGELSAMAGAAIAKKAKQAINKNKK